MIIRLHLAHTDIHKFIEVFAKFMEAFDLKVKVEEITESRVETIVNTITNDLNYKKSNKRSRMYLSR